LGAFWRNQQNPAIKATHPPTPFQLPAKRQKDIAKRVKNIAAFTPFNYQIAPKKTTMQ